MKYRIAVQSKGRLREASLDYLRGRGLEFEVTNGELLVPCRNADVEILFVRNSDIPIYVENGVAEMGIVGRNVLYENEFAVKVMDELGFGKCELVLAAPKGQKELEGERIATSYPGSLKKYLKARGINAAIIEIKGSVELAPQLGLADAVCEITQSGKTLAANNLKVVDLVLKSEACLITNQFFNQKDYEKVLCK